MPVSFKIVFTSVRTRSPCPISLYSMPITLPAMVMGSIHAITCILAYSETLYGVTVSGSWTTRIGDTGRRTYVRDVKRFGAMWGIVECLETASIVLHILLLLILYYFHNFLCVVKNVTSITTPVTPPIASRRASIEAFPCLA